jgi:hypothetical protein
MAQPILAEELRNDRLTGTLTKCAFRTSRKRKQIMPRRYASRWQVEWSKGEAEWLM